MAFCSHSVNSAGGNGCTIFLLILTWLRLCLGKVWLSFPFRYLGSSTYHLHSAVGRQLINCAEKELVTLQPPTGESCSTFMAQFISNRGGYLMNPDDVSNCRFCSSRTTDQWMEPSFNIFYSHHWRDFGLFCAYILFNVSRSLSCINGPSNFFFP